LESASSLAIEIDVDITESTSELKLNAIELDLGAATLTPVARPSFDRPQPR